MSSASDPQRVADENTATAELCACGHYKADHAYVGVGMGMACFPSCGCLHYWGGVRAQRVADENTAADPCGAVHPSDYCGRCGRLGADHV